MNALLATDSWVLDKFQQFTNYMSDTWGVSKKQLIKSCKLTLVLVGMLVFPAYHTYDNDLTSAFFSFGITCWLLWNPSDEPEEGIDPPEVVIYRTETGAYVRLLWLAFSLIWAFMGCMTMFQKGEFGMLGLGNIALIYTMKIYLESTTSPPKKKSKAKEKLEKLGEWWQGLWQPEPQFAPCSTKPPMSGASAFLFYFVTLSLPQTPSSKFRRLFSWSF